MCMRVDGLIPSTDELIQDLVIEDPLERCLTRSFSITNLKGEQISSIPDIAEAILPLEDSEKVTIMEEDHKTQDGLTLKELPKHLRYAFLSENGTKPVIISVAFSK